MLGGTTVCRLSSLLNVQVPKWSCRTYRLNCNLLAIQASPSKAMVSTIRPLVICGPSGVGKSTIVNQLLEEFPNVFGFSVSHTTRKPRDGEQVKQKHEFSLHCDLSSPHVAVYFSRAILILGWHKLSLRRPRDYADSYIQRWIYWTCRVLGWEWTSRV